MLGRKDYTQAEFDHGQAIIKRQLTAYKKLAATATDSKAYCGKVLPPRPGLLHRVEDTAAGEEIQITDRGRPVARIVPILRTRAEGLIESGRVRPARRPLIELSRPVRVPRGQPTASEVLARRRAEER